MAQHSNKEAIITFNNVCLSFDHHNILDNLSFEVYKGEIITIAGPSGSWKSTILKLIAGLMPPNSGEIIVKAERFGMAFQYGALFNSLTVWENIALALQETTKLNHEEVDELVKTALKTVSLENTEKMYPN